MNTDDVDALRDRYVASAVTLDQLCRESGAKLSEVRRLCRQQQWNRLRRARAVCRLESAEAMQRTLELGGSLLCHMSRIAGSWEGFSRHFLCGEDEYQLDGKRLRDFADTYRLVAHTLHEAQPAQDDASSAATSANSGAVVILPEVAQEETEKEDGKEDGES